jgi:hypothetical protein
MPEGRILSKQLDKQIKLISRIKKNYNRINSSNINNNTSSNKRKINPSYNNNNNNYKIRIIYNNNKIKEKI